MSQQALELLRQFAAANGFNPTERLQHFVGTDQSNIGQMITRVSTDPELLAEQLRSILEQDQRDQAQLVGLRKRS